MAEDLQRLTLTEVTRTGREELGRGSYAAVFKVMVQGTPCAAKEVYPILMSAKHKESFYAECIRSSQLLHPNIVQFMGIHYPSPSAELPWLVMEMMYISLSGLIEQRVKEGKDIPFHFKISMLVDTCQGLQFLHSKSIAHRDLSSNNIFLTKHLVAKIADLGMAKVMPRDAGQMHTMAPGTQVFMPPEALEGTNEAFYGITIDVFSLGCNCLHVISMQFPMPKPPKQLDSTTGRIVALTELERREQYLTVEFQHFPTLRALVCQCLDDFREKRPTVGAVLKDLRAIYRDVVPHENNNIIQLCDYYKNLLQQKDQELAQKNEQLDQQLNAMVEEKKQLTTKLLEAQKQLALKHEELEKAKEQLITKDQQLIGSQGKLQSQLLVDTRDQDMMQSIGSELIPQLPSYSDMHRKESVSKNKVKQTAKLCHGSGSISSDSELPLSQQPCVTNNTHSTMLADTVDTLLRITPHMPYSDNVFLDNDRNGDDEQPDNEDKTESYNEGGSRIRYERDFLLSLQFLEQCKQRPPNLMNAEYIRKALPRPSEMRFDPGYYDNMGPMGNRKKGPQGKTKKIDLLTKEPVELRKADKQWVGPAEQEADLAKTDRETQELFRKFVGILNKLTPQNFQTLANQVLDLPIDSEDRLKGCIDRINIKESEEPKYREAYARLSRILQGRWKQGRW